MLCGAWNMSPWWLSSLVDGLLSFAHLCSSASLGSLLKRGRIIVQRSMLLFACWVYHCQVETDSSSQSKFFSSLVGSIYLTDQLHF